jgi:DNA-binding GntR family transcriptional regulator
MSPAPRNPKLPDFQDADPIPPPAPGATLLDREPSEAGPPQNQTPAQRGYAEMTGFKSNATLIYESMRQRIAVRRYLPGTWLKEQEIAAEFGVSRTPVRQALQQLETEGLVEIRNGVGVRVTEVDDQALDQIYLLRLELVSLIGRAAPKPLSRKDLAGIRTVGDRLKEVLESAAPPEIVEFSGLCEDFHNLVNKMIGSPMLKHFIEVLYHQADRYWYGWMASTDPRREVEFLYHEVQETLRAAEIQDFEAVGLVRRNHISMMLARMAEFRKRQGNGGR